MQNSAGRIGNFFLFLTAIGFLLVFGCIAFNNRLASDDVYFLAMLKKQGFWDCFKNVYQGWSGRWTRTAYFFFVITLTDNYLHIHYFLFVYHLITILLFLFSFNTILRYVCLNTFGQSPGNKESCLFSILFTACFYFFTFDIIETWWWICSSFAYLQGICFFLAGMALLIQAKHNLFHYVAIGICFLYAGGCFEIYSLLFLSLFAWIMLAGLRNKKWSEWKEKGYVKAYGTALVCLLFSTFICVVAPGNYQRRAVVFETMHSTGVYEYTGLLREFVFQKKTLTGLLLSSLWIFPGMKLRQKSAFKWQPKKAMNALLGCILLIAGSVGVNYMVKMIILNNVLMPLRTFAFTSLAIAAFMSLLFLFAGYYFFYSIQCSSLVKIILPCCTAVMMFAYVYNQWEYTGRYAKCHDALIFKLLQAKAQAVTKLELEPLPDPGMLVPLYVGDPYIDWSLKQVLNLPFEIYLKE